MVEHLGETLAAVIIVVQAQIAVIEPVASVQQSVETYRKTVLSDSYQIVAARGEHRGQITSYLVYVDHRLYLRQGDGLLCVRVLEKPVFKGSDECFRAGAPFAP